MKKNDVYAFLEELLPYNKMLNEEYVIPEFKAEEYIRFAMSELRNQDKLKEYTFQREIGYVPVYR